ncbi:hypothetical protein RX327_26665 [Bradyrhizobium sp. BEA-2-5]|uniref:hypothetical protein n=1 Tax=Bradyrhizobium sp. BEA-2-5 TaxID=3080015 RepID=UPI00293F5939|nr:hypothetical protein [Bradyrhizobium sp. BEA-2-5]WOH79439.1 hypothetical protein RX327_26665 [Bradyrhizobium sp. BEA-2-5]
MANEAFALSPMSARAAEPNEQDYDAIREAFMETARGRWFLGEYAKRNRNADTSMVLDAVARIEESLSAQRQAAAAAIRDEQLAQALAALRGAIEATQASAIAALDGVSFEQNLAPVRKGVRVIREISWRLREIGNDGRICDIIDSQVSAIEAGAAEVSMDDAKAVLDAAFAALARRLSEFDPDKMATPAAEPAVAEAPVAEPPAAASAPPPMAESAAPDMAATPPAPPQEAAAASNVEAAIPAAEAATAVMPQPSEAWLKAEAALAEAEAAELARVTDEAAADAHDEAVLDLIAMEMGAADPIDEEAIAEEMRAAEEMRVAEAMAAEPEVAAPAIQPEPALAPAPKLEVKIEPPPVAVAPIAETLVMPPPLPPAVEPAPAPAAEISLGSTILASGILQKPRAPANDPLAPIRRMTQAEKIAFFS